MPGCIAQIKSAVAEDASPVMAGDDASVERVNNLAVQKVIKRHGKVPYILPSACVLSGV